VTAIVLLNKQYSGEGLTDVVRDVYDALDADYTPAVESIPVDEYNIPTGVFTVTITWSPE
jgi:hypothetical protein